ncbi:MAG: glycosyl hydrolase, partial [Terriglobales bacterium]
AQWGGRPAGATVAPGTYQARLSVNGKEYTVPIDLKPDPRLKVAPEDYAKQFELSTKIDHSLDEANRAVNQMRDVLEQLKTFKDRYKDNPQAKEVIAQGDALAKKITPVEEEIVQTKSHASEDPLNYPVRVNNKLLLLSETVSSAEGAPTKQSYEVYDELSKQLDASLAKWKQIESTDVAAFNSAVQKANLPAVVPGNGAE